MTERRLLLLCLVLICVDGGSGAAAQLRRVQQVGKVVLQGNELIKDERYCRSVKNNRRRQQEQQCPLSSSCVPFRNQDHCPLSESFPMLVQNRHKRIELDFSGVVLKDRYWYPLLEKNKIASHIFSADQNYPTPKLLYCGTVDGLLSNINMFPANSGIVIKATDLHSNKGVFVLPDGFGGMELLTQQSKMSLEQIKSSLRQLQTNNVIVEQFITGGNNNQLPTEYKFHMISGQIASINVVQHHQQGCGSCWAEMDQNQQRLDQYGCFVPSGGITLESNTSTTTSCPKLDVYPQYVGPVKGNLNLCDKVEAVPDCVMNDMVALAQQISQRIGVYVRVDMFLDQNNQIFVQGEYLLLVYFCQTNFFVCVRKLIQFQYTRAHQNIHSTT